MSREVIADQGFPRWTVSAHWKTLRQENAAFVVKQRPTRHAKRSTPLKLLAVNVGLDASNVASMSTTVPRRLGVLAVAGACH